MRSDNTLFSSAPWRQSAEGISPETMLAEQLWEETRYLELLEQARQEAVSPQELLKNWFLLARPVLDEVKLQIIVEEYENALLLWREGTNLKEIDEEGNPRWISLTLPKRRDPEEILSPVGVLPEGQDSAAPPKATYSESPQKSGGQEGFLAFLFPGRDNGPSTKSESFPGGKEILPGKARPRPVRRFLRIVLFGVILALIYHICKQRGWIQM